MKLLSKTSINYLWVTFTVLVITGILLFFFLFRTVSEEIREQLELQADMIVTELTAGQSINYPLVEITAIQQPSHTPSAVFRDTLIYDHSQKKDEGYYYLRQTRLIKGKPLSITVMTTHIGWDGYTQAIVMMFVVMAFLLVLAGGLVNYFVHRKIWNPFLLNLKILQSYSVSSKADLQLVPSSIDEFGELNLVVKDLAQRAQQEYTGLKEFTENASHEIQTPLTIIKSRLESMSQLSLNPEIAAYLIDTKQAVDRLSRLNRGLLLLAKLDNYVFPDRKDLQLDTMLLNMTEQMEDLFEQRGMRIVKTIQEKKIYASPYLLEILITNLLSNMLQHGKHQTEVSIDLQANKLTFSNQGGAIDLPHEKLFSRFGKTTAGYNGNGLGLSIIKQICTVHLWEIVYTYKEDTHIFQIHLLPSTSQGTV